MMKFLKTKIIIANIFRKIVVPYSLSRKVIVEGHNYSVAVGLALRKFLIKY